MAAVPPASVSPAPGLPRWWWIALAALTLVHAAVAWSAAANKGPSFDEIYDVTGGFFHQRYGDFRIHTDNGVFPQRIQGVAVIAAGARPPALEDNLDWRVADNSRIAYQFLHRSGNDADHLLRAARAASLFFGMGLVLLCGIVAAHVGGVAAGLCAAALATFSPTLLAHGAMATTDAAAALLLVGSALAFSWQLRRSGWVPALVSAILFGLATVTKYSAALLLPVFAILLLLRPLDEKGRRPSWGFLAGRFALHVLVAWCIVWATFNFRHAMAAPDLPPLADATAAWENLEGRAGWQGPLIGFLREHRLVPEGWLFGYVRTYVGTLFRDAFLAGEYSNTGWRSYFPLAFLWKSTPAELSTLALVLFAALRRRTPPDGDNRWLPPLLAFAAIYAGFSIFSRLNIGHRHLLPLYPVLFVLGGWAVAGLVRSTRARIAAVAVLAGAHALSASLVHPHHLAYFNVLAGGSAQGWRLLSDSSLDWGQDLPALRAWLDRHNTGPAAQRVHLAYFGSDEPAYRGLDVVRLPFTNDFKFLHPWYEPAGGLYCISATILQDVYGPVRREWTQAHERDYRELRALEPQFRQFFTDSAARAKLVEHVPAEQWESGWDRYDRLRLARLCFALRSQPPLDAVGHSILIYRLTDEELDAILR